MTQRDVALLEKFRVHANVPVSMLCKVLLKKSRATYYNWQRGSPPRKVAITRISIALKVLAMALRSGRLPIPPDKKGNEYRSAIVKALAESLRQVSTKLKQ